MHFSSLSSTNVESPQLRKICSCAFRTIYLKALFPLCKTGNNIIELFYSSIRILEENRRPANHNGSLIHISNCYIQPSLNGGYRSIHMIADWHISKYTSDAAVWQMTITHIALKQPRRNAILKKIDLYILRAYKHNAAI